MSIDLELPSDLVEIRLPTINIDSSQSSDVTDDPNGIIRTQQGSSDEDECHTPRSPKHMIPKVFSCPPAPKKPRRVPSCKRKLCDQLQFFEIVARDEVESFFRGVDMNYLNGPNKRRCLV